MPMKKIRNNYDEGYRAAQSRTMGGRRVAALLLLVGLVLFLWQVGFAADGGDGQTQASAPLSEVRMNDADVRLTADKEGIARWRAYQEELAESVGKVRVAVYSTHSSESYTSYSGEAKVYGQLGGVYRASNALVDELAAAGIGGVVDDTIHDWPDWNKSYANSLTTAENLLAMYPNLQVLIDMHRDAGVSRANSIVTVNGKSAAKIMLVCGSNKRYNHPNWQENKEFMNKIAEKTDEMYPGLLRRVSVQSGRYNQHIFNRAILVEMGTTENTIEEVEYSARLLANVLAVVLSEE